MLLALSTLRSIDGLLADLWALSTSLTAPIHLDKSPCPILSSLVPSCPKARLIPLKAVLAVATARDIVTGSNTTQRLLWSVYLPLLVLIFLHSVCWQGHRKYTYPLRQLLAFIVVFVSSTYCANSIFNLFTYNSAS